MRMKNLLFILFLLNFLSCQTREQITYSSFKQYMEESSAKEPYDSRIKSDKKALFILSLDESGNRKALDLRNTKDTIEDLERLNFQVSVRYTNSYAGVESILRSFPRQSIDIFILGAHGNPHYMEFKDGNLTKTLNIIDPKAYSLLKEKAPIVLKSCSTGKKPNKQKNWIWNWIWNDYNIASEYSCKIGGIEVLAPETLVHTVNITRSQENPEVLDINYHTGDFQIPSTRYRCRMSVPNDTLSDEERIRAKRDFKFFLTAAKGEIDKVKKYMTPSNLNKQNKNGSTALIEAVINKHIPTVKFLLDAGADYNIATNSGRTPLEISLYVSRKKIVFPVLADFMTKIQERKSIEKILKSNKFEVLGQLLLYAKKHRRVVFLETALRLAPQLSRYVNS